MRCTVLAIAASLLLSFVLVAPRARAEPPEQTEPTAQPEHWLWSTAWHIPPETTTEESGYFALVEGHNGRVYIGAAKYGDNAFLVEFDPAAARSEHGTNAMQIVVDAEKEIGVDRRGFAAQAKFHTRGNVGQSGRIYHGTKQGYPKEGEKRSDYLGGHPIVYDPATGKSRVYDIPIPHQGVISVAPDESRGVAYISTCSDERPIESTHFMILDLATGKYRDLVDCRHMYAFIVVDHLGRAYHPILGGEIARYDPRTDKLARLKQTIDGQPPSEESLLAHPESHPINWEISPDRKTLYAVAMSGNPLYCYDLTGEGDTLAGRSLGPLVPDARATDCRALCVAPDGMVWAGVAASYEKRPSVLRLVSHRPGDPAPADRGPIAIGNPDYTTFTDAAGKPKPHHNGVQRLDDGMLIPRSAIMGICAARDGTVYATTLSPFTLHAIRFPKVAGIATEYRHNSHADLLLSRMLESDTLDGQGQRPVMSLASLVTDQVPPSDTSRALARRHGFPIYDEIPPALTLEKLEKFKKEAPLAVDGVLLIAEHGKYPVSDTGQVVYPKRRMFEQIAATFRASGQSAPVFIDKHLADNWTDAKWIYDAAKELRAPLMAGSSLPVLWRYSPADVRRGAKLQEIVAVSYHTLDGYGFHALEIVQALAERRAGGETGVASVQCLTGKSVWEAEKSGLYDRRLLDEALSRLKERPLPPDKKIEELVTEPVLFVIHYRDGLRASVFTLNPAVGEWAAAWRYAGHEKYNEKNNEKQDGQSDSALFWTQEARPFMHFAHQLTGVEKMMQTGRPTWSVERTLLTSGVLDALLTSKRDGGKPLATSWLGIQYESNWDWRQPPPPPPSRPISEQ
jgi:hypothetical protein